MERDPTSLKQTTTNELTFSDKVKEKLPLRGVPLLLKAVTILLYLGMGFWLYGTLNNLQKDLEYERSAQAEIDRQMDGGELTWDFGAFGVYVAIIFVILIGLAVFPLGVGLGKGERGSRILLIFLSVIVAWFALRPATDTQPVARSTRISAYIAVTLCFFFILVLVADKGTKAFFEPSRSKGQKSPPARN